MWLGYQVESNLLYKRKQMNKFYLVGGTYLGRSRFGKGYVD